MEYTAVFAIEGIRNCEPVFAYKDGKIPEDIMVSIPKQFQNLPVATSKNIDSTYVLGVASDHINKNDMGTAAVSGILNINVSINDSLFKPSSSGIWLEITGRELIVGKILHKGKSFDADGECNSYTVQLMPWVSELKFRTDDILDDLKTTTEETITEAVNTLQANNNARITTAVLIKALAEPLQDDMTHFIQQVIGRSLSGI